MSHVVANASDCALMDGDERDSVAEITPCHRRLISAEDYSDEVCYTTWSSGDIFRQSDEDEALEYSKSGQEGEQVISCQGTVIKEKRMMNAKAPEFTMGNKSLDSSFDRIFGMVPDGQLPVANDIVPYGSMSLKGDSKTPVKNTAKAANYEMPKKSSAVTPETAALEFKRRLALHGMKLEAPPNLKTIVIVPNPIEKTFVELEKDDNGMLSDSSRKKERKQRKDARRALRVKKTLYLYDPSLESILNPKIEKQGIKPPRYAPVQRDAFIAQKGLHKSPAGDITPKLGQHTRLDSSSSIHKYTPFARGTLPAKPPPSEAPYNPNIPRFRGYDDVRDDEPVIHHPLLLAAFGVSEARSSLQRVTGLRLLSGAAPSFEPANSVVVCPVGPRAMLDAASMTITTSDNLSQALYQYQPSQATHSQSAKWISGTHDETQKFINATKCWNHMQFSDSPARPQNISEYLAVKAATLKEATERLIMKLESRQRSQKEFTVSFLAGKTFPGGLSTVLSQKTTWSLWPNGEEKAQWPSAIELKFDGDDRARSEKGNYGRHLPPPRLRQFDPRLHGYKSSWDGFGRVPFAERALKHASVLDAVKGDFHWDRKNFQDEPIPSENEIEVFFLGSELLAEIEKD